MPDLTPRQIVAELDKYIVGQSAARRAALSANATFPAADLLSIAGF